MAAAREGNQRMERGKNGVTSTGKGRDLEGNRASILLVVSGEAFSEEMTAFSCLFRDEWKGRFDAKEAPQK